MHASLPSSLGAAVSAVAGELISHMQQTLFCAGAIMSPAVESGGAVSLAVAGHRLDLMQVVVVPMLSVKNSTIIFSIRVNTQIDTRICMHSYAQHRLSAHSPVRRVRFASKECACTSESPNCRQ